VHWDVAHDYVGVPLAELHHSTAVQVRGGPCPGDAGRTRDQQNRLTAAIAAAVLSGSAALLVYYQWKVGKIGPTPDMSDHTWYPKATEALSRHCRVGRWTRGRRLFFVPRKSKAGF